MSAYFHSFYQNVRNIFLFIFFSSLKKLTKYAPQPPPPPPPPNTNEAHCVLLMIIQMMLQSRKMCQVIYQGTQKILPTETEWRVCNSSGGSW